jgi:hypothetical protein
MRYYLCVLFLLFTVKTEAVERQCAKIINSNHNAVSVYNKCNTDIVARVVDKNGNYLSDTGIIKRNMRMKLPLVGPSDFASIDSLCEVFNRIPCKPQPSR